MIVLFVNPLKDMKIKKEHEKPLEGSPLYIDLELGGQIINMRIICPVCGCKTYWLSEDHTVIYCSKCRAVMGQRQGNYVVTSDIKWEV